MARTVFRTSVVELAKLRADALMQENEKKAAACSQALSKKGLYQHEEACAKGAKEIAIRNTSLSMRGASFDSEQAKAAKMIDAWATNFACEDEFTLFVLIGPEGYVTHRIVNGF